MHCPACGSDGHAVIDSRPSGGLIRRRRSCSACGFRWSTIEIEVGAMRERVANIRAERKSYAVPPHLAADWRLLKRAGHTAEQTAEILGLSKVSN
jgi:hypothetical protein